MHHYCVAGQSTRPQSNFIAPPASLPNACMGCFPLWGNINNKAFDEATCWSFIGSSPKENVLVCYSRRKTHQGQSGTWLLCQSGCCCFRQSTLGWRPSQACRLPSGRWNRQTQSHHFWEGVEMRESVRLYTVHLRQHWCRFFWSVVEASPKVGQKKNHILHWAPSQT